MTALREAVLAEARAWRGTPYQHQASCRGAGTDCLGLIRGVWRVVYGAEPVTPPPYGRWPGPDEAERLHDAARRWLVARPDSAPCTGDVVLLAPHRGAPPTHCALVSQVEPLRLIHAWWQKSVVDTRMPPGWVIVEDGVFAFPALRSVTGAR